MKGRRGTARGIAWDEFRNEQLLRESDVLSARHLRLYDCFVDHPQRQKIIACEMGWPSHDEALAAARPPDASEDEPAPAFPPQTDDPAEDHAWIEEEEPPDPHREGLDWVRCEDGEITHPIAARARALMDALAADLADAATPLSSTDDRCAEALAQAMTLYVKLSAHLSFIARADNPTDPGQLIAWLKRDLALHGQLLAAFEALTDHPRLPLPAKPPTAPNSSPSAKPSSPSSRSCATLPTNPCPPKFAASP